MAQAELTEEERDAIRDARSKYGEDCVKPLLAKGADGSAQLVILRSASDGERTRWVDTWSLQGKQGGRANANRQLALSCMIYPPDPQARKAIIDRKPMRADDYAGKILEISGGEDEELEGNF